MTNQQQQIILEAQALEVMGDHDALDAWITSLSDDDFVLYQRWRNGLYDSGVWIITVRLADGAETSAGLFIFPLQAPDYEELEVIKDATVETFRKGLEILEGLSEYAAQSEAHQRRQSAFESWIRREPSRYAVSLDRQRTFRRLDDSHVAITKMKPLRQYAARR